MRVNNERKVENYLWHVISCSFWESDFNICHWSIKMIIFCLLNRTGDEKKEKGGEKSLENQNNAEHETVGKPPKLVHLEMNRGTAV